MSSQKTAPLRRSIIESAGCALIFLAPLVFATPAFPLDANAQDAGAREAGVRPVTLEEAQRLFRQNNLELMIARARMEAAAALVRDAAAFPNPTATVTHEPVSDGNADYSESYFNLSQRIEWSGARGARTDAASRLADAARADYRADSLRLAFDVSSAFARAVAATERVRVLDSVTELFRDADRAGEAMLEEGETSGYSLRRLRVERARYENRLSAALLEREAARRRLEILILPEADPSVRLEPVSEPSALPHDVGFERVLELARSRRPELDAAGAEKQAARAQEQLARRERLPDPQVTAGYKRQSDGFDGLFLGLATPIPIFDRGRGTIQAAQAQHHAAETRRILVERSVAADVRRAWDTFVSLKQRHELIAANLLAETDELLTAARVAYSEGEMSLVELLDAAEAYRDARTTTLDLRTDLRIAYYDLVRAAGGAIAD